MLTPISPGLLRRRRGRLAGGRRGGGVARRLLRRRRLAALRRGQHQHRGRERPEGRGEEEAGSSRHCVKLNSRFTVSVGLVYSRGSGGSFVSVSARVAA